MVSQPDKYFEMSKKKFTPTIEQITAAQNVFSLMAAIEYLKPIVNGYKRKILKRHQFTDKRIQRLSEMHFGEYTPNLVLEPEDDYQLEQQDFDLYMAEVNAARDKAGLKAGSRTNPCPLLEAQNILYTAERNLVTVMSPITGFTAEQLLNKGKSTYMKVVDLSLKALAPYLDKQKVKYKDLKDFKNIKSIL